MHSVIAAHRHQLKSKHVQITALLLHTSRAILGCMMKLFETRHKSISHGNGWRSSLRTECGNDLPHCL